jgi:hypothetical protein
MAKAPSFADRMSDPETQATASLKRIRYAPTGVEEATWAVAAAVFSLRDTMERGMTGTAYAEPAGVSGKNPLYAWAERATERNQAADRSQLTPEEVAEIQRTQADCPYSDADIETLRKQGHRPPVTREAVALAIASGVSGTLCVHSKGVCLANTQCQCARQTDAVMKLLEGGE